MRTSWQRRLTPIAITSAIFIAHVAGLVALFPSVGAIFNSEPVIEQDWGTHFHHLRSIGAFWDTSRRLWGYNPFFMAGYPSNTIQDFSVKIYEIVALAFPAGARVGAFKLSTVVAAALVPWAMFAAGRFFAGADGDDAGEPQERPEDLSLVSALMAGAGTLYWWNSYPREMFFYGMIGFPPACYLGLALAAAAWRISCAELRVLGAGIVWGAGLVVLLPTHLQAALAPAVAIVLAVAINVRRIGRRKVVWIIGGAAAAVVLNLFWLAPFWGHRGDAAPASLGSVPIFTTRSALDVIRDYAAGPPLWSFRESASEKALRWLLLIGGIAGLWRMWRSGRGRLALFLKINLLFFFVFTYFSGLVPALARIQPLRFSVYFNALLCVPAAWALARAIRPGAWTGRARLIARLWFAGIGVALGFFVVNLAQFERSHRLRVGLPAPAQAIIGWIRDRAPADARVLFEESGDESGFFYDGVYLSSFVPALTGRELIGGPANLYNDRHHYAEFHGGRLFGRTLARGPDGFSDEELFKIFDAYNIGAIVTFTPEAVMRFASLGDRVTLDATLGGVHFFRVRRELSWVEKGRARVRASYNRIEVSEAEGPLTLRYHWIEGLRAEPPTEIRKRFVASDPIPFIEIPSPPAKSFVLKVE